MKSISNCYISYLSFTSITIRVMSSVITNILFSIIFHLRDYKWRAKDTRGVESRTNHALKNSLIGGEYPRLGWVRIFNTKERVVVRVLTLGDPLY